MEGRRKKKKKNNTKFSGHYVYPRTETGRAHALRSHQHLLAGVKLCDTPNFTVLGHLEVPLKFLMGGGGWLLFNPT